MKPCTWNGVGCSTCPAVADETPRERLKHCLGSGDADDFQALLSTADHERVSAALVDATMGRVNAPGLRVDHYGVIYRGLRDVKVIVRGEFEQFKRGLAALWAEVQKIQRNNSIDNNDGAGVHTQQAATGCRPPR